MTDEASDSPHGFHYLVSGYLTVKKSRHEILKFIKIDTKNLKHTRSWITEMRSTIYFIYVSCIFLVCFPLQSGFWSIYEDTVNVFQMLKFTDCPFWRKLSNFTIYSLGCKAAEDFFFGRWTLRISHETPAVQIKVFRCHF